MIVEDVVVILWGYNVPVILRPQPDNQHLFLGDAYVHEIMHGEFLSTNPALETFNMV